MRASATKETGYSTTEGAFATDINYLETHWVVLHIAGFTTKFWSLGLIGVQVDFYGPMANKKRILGDS